ncbi:hypothetical protein Pla108_41620 [Botrimarina colliarenosi]|uniref:PEP-CTERM protein-sorting domain-containing protein n=1 Tax=Botrimarina colliarenosi TaxID=2528001 RepID=A0A5C5ZXM7_9BACT|nr:PEP-CTERM sorting domain-containing protein [Botrimarina colliarenosi]TWT92019.1 hypothetical protein Pla108_41620 [Botrimarina colliarenosi]
MLSLLTFQRVFAAAAVLVVPVAASAVVVDDFESYSPGDLQTVGAPAWTVENAGDSTVVSDGSNQYLTYGGTGDWRHSYRESGAAIFDTGSISFRLFVEAEATDHAIGLVGTPEGTNGIIDWYGDYGPYIRVTDDTAGAAGVVSLDTRDGGSFVDDIATLNLNQWYDVRLDIDTTGGDAGLGGFNIFLDNTQIYTSSDFRRAFDGPLANVLLMAGSGVGQTVRVDDIEVDGVVLLPGDTDGNGTVELDDYYPIRDNFQQAVANRFDGDLDLSGRVDFLDFREWKSAYVAAGNSLEGISFSFLSVPEPTSGLLALVGLIGLARRR